jgi:hypothetical protein
MHSTSQPSTLLDSYCFCCEPQFGIKGVTFGDIFFHIRCLLAQPCHMISNIRYQNAKVPLCFDVDLHALPALTQRVDSSAQWLQYFKDCVEQLPGCLRIFSYVINA